MDVQERALKSFMYKNLYHHPLQVEAAKKARLIVEELFQAYQADTNLLPSEWQTNLPEGQPQRSRHIADFLAGMTDRYAELRHSEIFGEKSG
jgi:dGTPase